MSNRIDFFQSEQRRLSLPAASVSILIDGTLCPSLETIEIVRGDWPEFSSAKFVYNPAAHTGEITKAVEDIEYEFAAGKTVCIRQYYNDIPPGAAVFSFPIFNDQIDSIETRRTDDDETVKITARDFGTNLKRISVYGRRLAKADGSNVFLAGLDTVFNPDSKGNACPASIDVENKTYTVFAAESTQGRPWSYAEVIDYLLCEYIANGQLQMPTIAQLRAWTGNRIVRDLDVTGLNLAEALRRCCETIGLMFKFVPLSEPTGPDKAIVFYKPGTGRAVELNCQHTGDQLSISKTDIAELRSRKNFWPITHRYLGRGDFKVYEATFELVKAWDAGLEDTEYDKFSPSTNPDFYQVRDVYRKWCLNEAGQYSGAPYNQGDAFDFSRIFQSSNFVHRRRRFRPALTTNLQGDSLGYFLQVSYDGGQSWSQYLHAFNNLPDECGLWLSSDCLDEDTWTAAITGLLKFRITASVNGDERLSCSVADGPVNSTAPVIDHVITLPHQFNYRKVSDQSIFAGADDEMLGTPDEIDDTDALYEFVRSTTAASPDVITTTEIQTPRLMLHYNVGDIVTMSPESRDLLACRSDNRSKSRIVRVQMDFERQCTNLKIVRQRNRQF
ncbi:MAG TPA: hypothetical protein DIU00_03410 [Phycisphaerales bacterium]|nr:hypothetical protein [Phycisphaerales bacterium]